MKSSSAATILRWGLAFVFFYAALASLLHPEAWEGYLPGFLTGAIPARLLLSIFAIYELILAGWLFFGRKLVWAAGLAALTFVATTFLNLSILDITFRDIGLAMAALALLELSRQKDFKEE